MTTKKITRRSRLGWGYNTKPTGHGTEIELAEKPDYIGTVHTICQQIDSDRNYQSMKNNTYYTNSWFVKVNGAWMPVKNAQEMLWELDFHGSAYAEY